MPDKRKNYIEPLKYHPIQDALFRSKHRFDVVPAGRRSGKTEIVGKRRLIYRAYRGSKFSDARYGVCAPTHSQARKIYWADLKRMVSRKLIYTVSESDNIITLINGSEIHVIGMDKPERIEGSPWDGLVLDEYGNMKKKTWGEHVRPALADRNGWCSFIGVPEGRNHYYDLYKAALADTTGRWGVFHWVSADVLAPGEIEQAKKDLDELTFEQEYCGCHLPDARIMLYDGTSKAIKDVKKGDVLVYLSDEGIIKPTIVQEQGVTGVKDIVEVKLENGEAFKASKYHKMKVENESVPLIDAEFIEKWNGKELEEIKIIDRKVISRQTTYNISVDSPDTSYLLADGTNNYNSFINFTGRAYYPFDDKYHCDRLFNDYNPDWDLIFAFDFNVSPGVANIIQEFPLLDDDGCDIDETLTAVIGEVHIRRNSNTEMICRKLIKDWGNHRGRILCYGDVTGGAAGTAQLHGSDWDIIERLLCRHYGDNRVKINLQRNNPLERDRVNATNSRLKSVDNDIHLMIDPSKAPFTVKDFEGVCVVEGGSGELDKRSNPELTHHTDAVSYYIHYEFPIRMDYDPLQSFEGF